MINNIILNKYKLTGCRAMNISIFTKKNFQGLFRVTKNGFDNYTEQFNNLRAPFCWRTSQMVMITVRNLRIY